MKPTNNLKEVAIVFFKLGCFAFGGPAAHIAMMEDEVVTKREWMTRDYFLDLIGATNLIPGPNSTEMTMHCGYERAGKTGLFVAGICFIFPAIVITGFLAWLYVEYGELPEVAPFIFGIKPAVLAIIASAILKLGRKAIKGWEIAVLGILVFLASVSGVNEILALLGAGLIGMVYFQIKTNLSNDVKSISPLILLSGSVLSTVIKVTTQKVFWTFLKVGAVLYGSGYVLFAYLDTELVGRGWLTRPELIDAIAVGQFTPGPVLSTATFIGYQLTGFWGAIAATTGIFLPSFLFVLILNPFIPRMRQSKILRYFLDSVNIAAVAVMLAVLYVMTIDTLTNWKAILITIICAYLTFWTRISVIWTVIIGAVLGFVLNFIVF
ncbi:MAG: chromate efflux transporter [Flavobacteriaceae bacterium]|nr:chromate efflux transporter [Bacteroidia bacterium]NND10717.1 chromate efflux transporter [Flavobacteriaceae bacterium]NNK28027.1 chromate efflux transporter [Flavobacteriaceae bacterium]NNL60801.1 chromate efflux transporter [Flavobacteriaceae bacterium]RZV60340.1 MAG: chromate efflux transporter [Flavobacteriaceae bacterium]